MFDKVIYKSSALLFQSEGATFLRIMLATRVITVQNSLVKFLCFLSNQNSFNKEKIIFNRIHIKPIPAEKPLNNLFILFDS